MTWSSGDWIPIATAPKDGTRVLIYIPPSEDDSWIRTTGMHVAKYISDVELWSMPGVGGLQPTHWLPLPGVPTSTESK